MIAPQVATATNKAERTRQIVILRDEYPEIVETWDAARRKVAGENHFVKHTGVFPRGSQGKLNTYRLFAELGLSLTLNDGRLGMVLKSGILTAQDSQPLIGPLLEAGRVVLGFDFINLKPIFPAVVANERFCLLVVTGGARNPKAAKYAFTLTSEEQAIDESRTYELTASDLKVLNPNDSSVPPLASRRDKTLLLKMYSLQQALVVEASSHNLWQVRYAQGHINSATGSDLFGTNTFENLESRGGCLFRDSTFSIPNGERFIPLYEGKFIGQQNHRFGTFAGVTPARRFGVKAEANAPSPDELQEPDYEILPRYWLREADAARLLEAKGCTHQWLFAFRDVCRAVVDARTVQACVLPSLPCNDKCPLLIIGSVSEEAGSAGILLNTVWASFVFDYATRQKLHGSTLTKAIAYQLPVPSPDSLKAVFLGEPFLSFIWARGLELTYVTYSLSDFAVDCRYTGPPFRWDPRRRFLIKCELDAAYFHLYLGRSESWCNDGADDLARFFQSPRDAVDYIMDTFPIVKRRDEQQHGEYRTKRVILEIYDAMADVIRTGRPYQTPLNPPPGPPAAGLPDWKPHQPRPANWPSHIHPPRHGSGTAAGPSLPQSAPSAPAAPATWQMTRGQYQDYCKTHGRTDVTENNRTYWREVESAIQAGKLVPANVLADYEQLKGVK